MTLRKTLLVYSILTIWIAAAPIARGQVAGSIPFTLLSADPATCVYGSFYLNVLTNTVRWCPTHGINDSYANFTPGSGTSTIASGSLALATNSISSGSCQAVSSGVNNATATGVATTDVIAFTPNASIKAVTGYTPTTTGGLTITAYPTANAVNFDVCNWSGSPITPGAVTINWRVTR